jgi:adenosylmethionine-8-amino-7-oxononanoate aminotransferase
MSDLLNRDEKYIWHPYTQMGLKQPVLPISSGRGALLFDENGNEYIDAISSWWTNIHGHAHPYMAQKIAEQLNVLEHVIFAGATHKPAVDLAERLLQHLPKGQEKIFYSDNGSTAVEVAIKMSLQYWHNKGASRTRILAFENAYHGDTFGAMSVSGRSIFTQPFQDMLFEVDFVPVPIVGKEDHAIEILRNHLAKYGADTAAFIFEPLVQGTAGMVMYAPEALDKILSLCRNEGILTIADEVMTGFGRTGKFFACDYLNTQPDMVCLSKGLTGGAMAFGVTSCSDAIYQAFCSSDKTKTLFHGHSYTGSPIACAAALASLDLMEREETSKNIARIQRNHLAAMERFSQLENVRNCRVTGTILALDVVNGEDSYLNEIRDRLYNYFIGEGVLLRPLGNIVYILPPYCIDDNQLNKIYDTIESAIKECAMKAVTTFTFQ